MDKQEKQIDAQDQQYDEDRVLISRWVLKCASERTRGDIGEAVMVVAGTVPDATKAILRQIDDAYIENEILDRKMRRAEDGLL